jgi:hypothetical protein
MLGAGQQVFSQGNTWNTELGKPTALASKHHLLIRKNSSLIFN